MKKRFADLFAYLHSTLRRHPCDHTLKHTQEFARANHLYFGELSQMLEDCGGYCDCEVLLNAARRIPGKEIIGAERFRPPRRLAIEREYYCHCRVAGIPVPLEEAVAARESGAAEVEFWVPCGIDDLYAEPDYKRASGDQFNEEGTV
jgi:hypothetical protein